MLETRLRTFGSSSLGDGTSTSFTSGSVMFVGQDGTLQEDNTNLFWDDTNNRLGIGTNAPNAQLEVRGTLPYLYSQATAGNNSGFIFGQGNNTGIADNAYYGIIVDGSNGTGGFAPANDTDNLLFFSYVSGFKKLLEFPLGTQNAQFYGQVLIDGFSSSTKGFIVKGAASQSASLFETQSSTGAILTKIASDGAWSSFKAAASNGEFQLGSASSTNMNPFFAAISESDSTGLYIGHYRSTSQSALTGYGIGATYINTDGWAMTTGRLLNVANNSNAKFTVDFEGKVGVGQRDPGSQLGVLIATSTTIGQIIKGAASQSANLLEAQNSSGTAYVTVGPPTLAGNSTTSNFFNITGTVNSTNTQPVYAMNMQITAAGSSAQPQFALNAALLDGYSGSAWTSGARFQNSTAGTGGNFFDAPGNSGFYAFAEATTTGTNQGGWGFARNGDKNAGLVGQATTAKNSATNIGVVGFGRNTGTTPIQLGGYFGLNSSEPTFTSAALMCDNDDQTSDIFVARDNGTVILTIADGGTLSGQNIEPRTDDTYYLGKNDDDSPKAWKGVILKDTTNGKYYRIEVINGVVTATDLTD